VFIIVILRLFNPDANPNMIQQKYNIDLFRKTAFNHNTFLNRNRFPISGQAVLIQSILQFISTGCCLGRPVSPMTVPLYYA
jgi:hypothetical protein